MAWNIGYPNPDCGCGCVAVPPPPPPPPPACGSSVPLPTVIHLSVSHFQSGGAFDGASCWYILDPVHPATQTDPSCTYTYGDPPPAIASGFAAGFQAWFCPTAWTSTADCNDAAPVFYNYFKWNASTCVLEQWAYTPAYTCGDTVHAATNTVATFGFRMNAAGNTISPFLGTVTTSGLTCATVS